MEWQLQDAKNRFSELVQRARQEGPQVVTLRGRRAAVVLSAEAYDALLRERPSLVDHLLAGPAWDDDLVDAVNLRAKAPSRPPAVLMFLLDTNVVSRSAPPHAGGGRLAEIGRSGETLSERDHPRRDRAWRRHEGAR